MRGRLARLDFQDFAEDRLGGRVILVDKLARALQQGVDENRADDRIGRPTTWCAWRSSPIDSSTWLASPRSRARLNNSWACAVRSWLLRINFSSSANSVSLGNSWVASDSDWEARSYWAVSMWRSMVSIARALAARRVLVCPILADALDFEIEAGISGVNGADDLPLVERLIELLALFVKLGLGDDGLHQIAFILDEAERSREVFFRGILAGGFFQDGDTEIEIRFLIDAAVGFGDEGGELLPLPLLDIELEGLKEGVVGIAGEVLLAERERAREIFSIQLAARLFVGVLQIVVLAADLVVEAVRGRSGLLIGFRRLAVEGNELVEAAERVGDIAALPGLHSGFVDLRLLLADLGDFGFAAGDFGEHAQRFGLVRLHLKRVIQGLAGLAEAWFCMCWRANWSHSSIFFSRRPS